MINARMDITPYHLSLTVYSARNAVMMRRTKLQKIAQRTERNVNFEQRPARRLVT